MPTQTTQGKQVPPNPTEDHEDHIHYNENQIPADRTIAYNHAVQSLP